MARFALLVFLLVVVTGAAGASSDSVTVKTVVLRPKVITDIAAEPAHAGRGAARAKPRAVHAPHVPRPLSPGEFGRVRQEM